MISSRSAERPCRKGGGRAVRPLLVLFLGLTWVCACVSMPDEPTWPKLEFPGAHQLVFTLPEGSADSRACVVSNASGDAPLEISGITSTHSGWFWATPGTLTIQPGRADTVIVTATAAGPAGQIVNGSLEFQSNDPDGPQTLSVRVEVSQTDPDIRIEPAGFDPVVAPGGIWVDSLRVRNAGVSDLVVSTITDGSPWLSESPTGPFTITAGDSLWVTVQADAGGLLGGTYRDTISVSSNDPDTPECRVPVRLLVSGEPDVLVRPDSLRMTVEPGGTWYGAIFVLNEGGVDLTVDSLTVDAGWVDVIGTGFTVTPGDSQQVGVGVDAAGLGDGEHEATITVHSNDPDTPAYPVPVCLHVAVEPDIDIEPSAVQVALAAGETAEETLLVYNRGSADLIVTGIADDAGWLSETGSGGFTVPADDPDRWEVVVVTVDASSLREGDYAATITISSNDPDAPEAAVPVAVEVLEPHIAVSRDTLQLAVSVGGSGQDTLTVGNTGSAILVVHSLDDDATDPDWLSANPSSFTVAPGGHRVVTAAVDATGLTGGQVYQATLTVSSNDLDTPEYQVVVRLEVGGEPDIEVVPNELNVTVEPYGTRVDSLRVRNTGTVALVVNDVTDGADWLAEDPVTFAVAPGGSQWVVVTIDAADLPPNQTYGDTVTVHSNDPDTPEYGIPVTVHVEVAPDISVVPEAFDLTVPDGLAVDTSLTVSNVGSAALDVDSLSTGSAWLQVDPGGFTIPSGGFPRAVGVSADAGQLQPGAFADTILIYSNDPVDPILAVPVALEVTPAADITVSPTTLAFSVSVGGTQTQYLTIGNDASASADLVVSNVTDGQAWLSEDPTSFAGIAPGTSEQVGVTVDAGGLSVGSYSGTITIASNDPDENPYQVPVTLQVVAPDIWVSPTSLEFTVEPGGSQMLNLTVGNDASATADLLVSNISDDAAWLSEDPTTLPAIVPGGSGQVAVTADASGLSVGDYTATITIVSNDPDENPYDVPVTLHVASPDIYVSPSSLDFTVPVGSNQTKYLTIGNESYATADLVVSSISDDRTWLTENPTGFPSISPGSSEQVAVTADAEGMGVGDYAGTITIASNDPDENPYQVPVTLHVVAPDIYVSPTSLDFTVPVGSNQTKYLTIGNESYATADLVVYDISSVQGWLTENPTGFAGISPGASEQAAVTADAGGMSAGDYFGTITITSNDPDENPYQVPVTLHVVEPDIWVSPTSLEFTLASGGTQVQSLTVGNDGSASADLAVYSITDDAGDPPVIPDWLSEDPSGFASIPPGGSEQVSVTADGTGLDPGSVHYATITIVSNDPDENPYPVPVVLNVQP
jgi:uncharacterized membrane protein